MSSNFFYSKKVDLYSKAMDSSYIAMYNYKGIWQKNARIESGVLNNLKLSSV